MRQIKARQVIRYTLTPQLMPRLRKLFGGFTFISFFMAQIYRAVGLLPVGHPYLDSANMGRFGVRHVVAEAGLGLKEIGWRSHIDRHIVFWILMVGLAILVLQFLLLGISLFAGTSFAQEAATNYFQTPNPTSDLAFIIMDRVFGVPNLFNSCVAQGIECFDNDSLASGSYWTDTARSSTASVPFPYPIHKGLHAMLQLYSIALLVIAMVILIYFIGAIAAETAETGTPFGKRFNHVWAPVRLVVAVGLLIPVANGLNSAQYITLYSAKFGSSFATNGWTKFFTDATSGGDTILGKREKLIAIPQIPPVNNLMVFFSLVSVCKVGHEYHSTASGRDTVKVEIKPYLINPSSTSEPFRELVGTSFDEALKYFKNGDMLIRFGHQGTDPVSGQPLYGGREANVLSICGDLRFNMPATTDQMASPGGRLVLQKYYELILQEWNKASGDSNGGLGEAMKARFTPDGDASVVLPTAEELQKMRQEYAEYIGNAIDEGAKAQADSDRWVEDMVKLGWAGAGIWYNKIAEVNGSFMNAVYALPEIARLPLVMKEVEDARKNADQDMAGIERFNPTLSGDHKVPFSYMHGSQIGNMYYYTLKMWEPNADDLENSSNALLDFVHALFGTSGLFNIHENAEREIHPLAQLTAIGKSLLDSAVRNIGLSAVAGTISAIGQKSALGPIGAAASSFFSAIGFTALTIGFLLYYIVPFMPFIYFFVAVGGWVKGIFEAMVGVPLWALAHLRIDGNGLPGDAAMGGYYLILEVFLRPILIIFGMLASILIFAAQVAVLHEIWPLVVSNLTGFDNTGAEKAGENATGAVRYLRGVIDQIFFTAIYAVVVYMLGTSCFKLVDQVPDGILRWIGAGLRTFGDAYEDQAQNLSRNTLMGSGTLISQFRQVGAGAGDALKNFTSKQRADGGE